MKHVSLLRFSLCSIVGIFVLIGFSALYFSPQRNVIMGATEGGADEALSFLKDSTLWLASIQTATIAALGLLAKDGAPTFKLSTCQLRLVTLVVILNTLALFFSAWVLTSLPSIALRAHIACLGSYDIFNLPLYNLFGMHVKSHPWIGHLDLQFFSFWNHCLWWLGIFFFGIFSISVAKTRSEAQTDVTGDAPPSDDTALNQDAGPSLTNDSK